MITIKAHPACLLCIGRRGENMARQVEFDLSGWQKKFGPGTAQLLVQRQGDKIPYKVPLTVEGSNAVWTVQACDVDVEGRGRVELQYYVGETVAKSAAWQTLVAESLGTPDGVPVPVPSWVDQVAAAAAAAEVSAAHAAERASGAAGSAQAAERSRAAIENMTAAAATLRPEQPATVESSAKDGVRHLLFGIPQGERGAGWWVCVDYDLEFEEDSVTISSLQSVDGSGEKEIRPNDLILLPTGAVGTVKAIRRGDQMVDMELAREASTKKQITLKGEKGDPGRQGPAGLSAYQAAQEAGFAGTEAEFGTILADAADKTYVDTAITGAIGTVLSSSY